MVTEIFTFHLKVDVDLSDPTSPASKAVLDVLRPELAAEGAHHAYYGQFIEKPEMGIIFVKWDSVEHHKSFMSSL